MKVGITMGWTSYEVETDCKGNVNRKQTLDKQFTEDNKTTTWEVEKSAMVGTTYYCALTRTDKETGEKRTFGMVALTSVDNSQWNNFSYKEMDESMQPYCYDCPESILNLLSPTKDKWSNEWREACRVNNKHKKQMRNAMKAFKVGDKIKTKLWYDEYVILTYSIYKNRKTWIDWDNRIKYKKKDVFKYPFSEIKKEPR